MSKSSIEWTEQTWNPIVGCSILSPGCKNCYAMLMAARIEAMNAGLPESQRNAREYEGTTKKVNGHAVWTGKLAMAGDHKLLAPLRRKKPTTYFVNSMGDLFHEGISDEQIDRVFAVMALTPQHTYQVLTKRAERMRDYFAGTTRTNSINGAIWSALGTPRGSKIEHGGNWRCALPFPNVWLGVSTERQQEADERIPLLLQTPAAVRFISVEPMLGPINLHQLIREAHGKAYVDDALTGFVSNGHGGTVRAKLDWVIVGGESGPGARPMQPDWARSLRNQCNAAKVPFFFKQWGEFLPVGQHLPGYGKIHGATATRPGRLKLHYGGTPTQKPEHAFADKGVDFASTDDGRLTFRVGKKLAGRTLDGTIHDEYPEAARR